MSPDSPPPTMVLLAPAHARIPDSFYCVEDDVDRHEALLAGMQRLRGRLYLNDGAIESWQLTKDGRHVSPVDVGSWHLLVRPTGNAVAGCARYLQHDPTVSFSQLTVAQSALAGTPEWGDKLKAAVEAELSCARAHQLAYVELGGWALHEELRATTEALRIVIAAYALAEALGGCLGITTATFRNQSSSILRRLGGCGLMADGVELPAYYDPAYRCQMEILRFNSATPNPKFLSWAARMRIEITRVPVVCRRAPCGHESASVSRDSLLSLRALGSVLAITEQPAVETGAAQLPAPEVVSPA